MDFENLDPRFEDATLSAIRCMGAVDSLYPNLRERDLGTYISTIVNRQIADGNKRMCVVVIAEMSHHRKKEIELLLKGMSFPVSTVVQVRWDDESEYLEAFFQKKAPAS